ncbi:MAG: hypothetical protein AAB351_02235 [Patescibacteria group bacterium]
MKKELLRTQIAFFLKKEFNAFEAFALEIKKVLGETETRYLPVPTDAPVQFPRLIIDYKTFNIQVFKNRIDLFFQENYDQETLLKVINVLSSILGLPIGRVGFVKTLFVESDIMTLKNLLPEEKIKSLDIKEINLRINVRRTIGGFKCNSIEKIDPGNVTKNTNLVKSGLIVSKDCNTIAEEALPDNLESTALQTLIKELDDETKIFILI